MEYNIRIGGEAGQGLQFIGSLLARFFARSGYHVFTDQDYMSRIRGGHNFYQLRVADHPVEASRDQVDVLLALDLTTILTHRKDLNERGLILYDPESVGQEFSALEFQQLPLTDLVREKGIHKIMANSVAVGAVLGLFGLELGTLVEIIGSLMHGKGEDVIAMNRLAAQTGYDYIALTDSGRVSLQMPKQQGPKLMLINGNQAIGLAALLSGCKFFSAYPMTPSTSIMVYLAGKAKKYGIIVEQAEDEIAAINMALGASFGGVRAMTATSGGGFALMTEGVSLAAITETPIVVAEVQRPGPATGLPTRTEQGDLFFVMHGGHGEFPRVILAPGTPEQAFYLTNKAFYLAEKYQVPVIIQSDQYLADSEWTYTGLDPDFFLYEDFRLRGDSLRKTTSYKRYSYNDRGVSPLAVPGESRHLVVADSDEHDEDGHIIEDAQTRINMVQKRLHRKLPFIRQEIAPPVYHGDRNPKFLLIGYGSTYGVMKEAMEHLAEDYKIGMLHFSEVWPFPLPEKLDYVDLLTRANRTICIENNATSQFARLIRMETGIEISLHINKYDGRPFRLGKLLGEINERLRGL